LLHHILGEKQKPLGKGVGENTIAWLDKLRNANGSLPTSNIRLNMQRVMQNNAAVFRTEETLEEGMNICRVALNFSMLIIRIAISSREQACQISCKKFEDCMYDI
jgi:succinate dehydrogenase/fumarate reductase flavoprotein subunit